MTRHLLYVYFGLRTADCLCKRNYGLGLGLIVAAAYAAASYPRESFASRGLWNRRRTFVCLFVCLSVTTITK